MVQAQRLFSLRRPWDHIYKNIITIGTNGMLCTQCAVREELENTRRETTEVILMVLAALEKWKKELNELDDNPMYNQDDKTAAAVKFPLAKEETFYFAAVPWFVGIFCVKQGGGSTRQDVGVLGLITFKCGSQIPRRAGPCEYKYL